MHLPFWRKFMRKIAVAILMSTSLLLSACNTVKGLGRDIESVGDAGDRAI
jgi:predicted small secreted protein